ncbi:hypothetical protein ANANG_G00229790 [Anguilla anguilla]|uniref:Uncharacterized protein n=1 Tax=Anguilla anguilla TaxID=7936 RepID=A0A9D3RQC8_ANGAN|nr:hypothetical protein ANANG_G00229790 [Anguilla anguilla]
MVSRATTSLLPSPFAPYASPPCTPFLPRPPARSRDWMGEAESAYLHVRYGVCESDGLEPGRAPPCRSHPAPRGAPPPPPRPYYYHARPLRAPKPHPREGCVPEECGRPAPRSVHIPRKISQQPLLGCKGDPTRVAWEHTISEE